MHLEELFKKLKSGDISALNEIYTLTYDAVYVSALLVIKNKSDAEDIAQDTFVKAVEKISHYKEKGYGKAWLCAIARNLALDRYRKNKKLSSFEDLEKTAICAEKDYIEEGGIIELAEKILTSEEFEILIAHIKAGLSHKETAKYLNKNYASVRWTYFNALRKLKKKLEKNEGEYEI